MLKQYATYDMLICQNRSRKLSQECQTAPIKCPISMYWLAIVQVKIGHLEAKISAQPPSSGISLRKLLLLLSQFLLQKKMEDYNISYLTVWFYGLDNQIYLRCLVS